MRNVALGCLLLTVAAGCRPAASPAAEPEGPAPGVPFFEGMGDHARTVTTSSKEAQRYFDQGLAFLHGFNHDEAIRSFETAARLDPDCAMAHWGWPSQMALTSTIRRFHRSERRRRWPPSLGQRRPPGSVPWSRSSLTPSPRDTPTRRPRTARPSTRHSRMRCAACGRGTRTTRTSGRGLQSR